MPYVPLFDPSTRTARDAPRVLATGDRSRLPVYDYEDDTRLALNVALATGRPLLLRGETGSGKSSLARHVAYALDVPYLEEVITSRTRAEDLLWTFDALGRLRDAQAQEARAREPARYVEPGVLWWAFAPVSAARRGLPPDAPLPDDLEPARDPAERWEDVRPADAPAPAHHLATSVVLLDEIDKADPDLPNNLLEVLGARRFTVRETRATIGTEGRPLVMIATNAERELPDAFVRRCIPHRLTPPTGERLERIGALHFPDADAAAHGVTGAVRRAVRERLDALAAAAKARALRGPSAAEYLDALRAISQLGSAGAGQFDKLTTTVLWKHDAPPETPS